MHVSFSAPSFQITCFIVTLICSEPAALTSGMDCTNRSLTLPRTTITSNENQSTRPLSFYDNIRENGQNSQDTPRSRQNFHELTELPLERERSPNQEYCLNTTVPQNITVNNISGKHAPTRNSLRHSRMIVMTRSGRVLKNSASPVLRYYKLATALVGLQVLFGAALCCLALWFLLWAPHIRTRDNPYWSALPLLLSGFFGLLLLCCCRKEYHGMPRGYFIYSTKVVSVTLSIIAGTVCLIACTFAIIHLISLYTMTCGPGHQLNATCICRLSENFNETSLPIKSYHYVDLSCPEVDNILNVLVIFSTVTNGLAGFTSLWYVYIHWASRYTYTYSRVSSKENRPMVITNM